MTSKLYQRGLEMRKQVLGAAHVEKTLAATDQDTQRLQEIVNEYLWGAVWARPGHRARLRFRGASPQDAGRHRARFADGTAAEKVAM